MDFSLVNLPSVLQFCFTEPRDPFRARLRNDITGKRVVSFYIVALRIVFRMGNHQICYSYLTEAKRVEVLGTGLSNEHGLHTFSTNVSIAEFIQSSVGAALLGRGKGRSRSDQGGDDGGLHGGKYCTATVERSSNRRRQRASLSDQANGTVLHGVSFYG